MAEPVPTAEPAWISSAWRNAFEEVHLYFATLVGFTRSPARFSSEWADGRRRAMNPVGFVASGASALGLLLQVLMKAMGNEAGFGDQLVWALAPYLYYSLLGAAAHLLLRPRRRRLSTSLGVSLYAGGAAATLGMGGMVLALVGYSFAGHSLPHENALAALPPGYHRLVTIWAICGFGLFLAQLSIALRAIHQTRRPAALLAVAAAVLLVGVVMSLYPLPTLRLGYLWPAGARFPHPVLMF